MPPAVLDSPPLLSNTVVPAPQPRRNLKRSASTASLLTPPRTVKRKGRKGARNPKPRPRAPARESDFEVTDNDETSLGSGGGRRLDFGRKKRRIGDLDARLDALIESIDGEDAENPFWVGPSKITEPAAEGGESSERVRSPSPPLVHFRGKAPVSPPPSRRRRVKTAKIAKTVVEKPQLPSLPSTPKGKRREEEDDLPVRDSDNNPFLDSSPLSVSGEPIEPRTPTESVEKPTITYVFRGVRTTFANPMYNLPAEVHERSLLPVEHPDYSPDPACPPKLLFADAHRKRAPSTPTRAGKSKSAARSATAIPSKHSDNEWNDSDDDDDLHLTPPKKLFC